MDPSTAGDPGVGEPGHLPEEVAYWEKDRRRAYLEIFVLLLVTTIVLVALGDGSGFMKIAITVVAAGSLLRPVRQLSNAPAAHRWGQSPDGPGPAMKDLRGPGGPLVGGPAVSPRMGSLAIHPSDRASPEGTGDHAARLLAIHDQLDQVRGPEGFARSVLRAANFIVVGMGAVLFAVAVVLASLPGGTLGHPQFLFLMLQGLVLVGLGGFVVRRQATREQRERELRTALEELQGESEPSRT